MKHVFFLLLFSIPLLVQGQGNLFYDAFTEGMQHSQRERLAQQELALRIWMQESQQAHELRMQEVSDAQYIVILLALHIDRRKKEARNAYSTGTLSADNYRELERNLMAAVREIREGLPPDLRRLFNLALK